VRQHDIRPKPLEPGAYDLAHYRDARSVFLLRYHHQSCQPGAGEEVALGGATDGDDVAGKAGGAPARMAATKIGKVTPR